ncbi:MULTISPECIES: uracil-xanthine permease family protein [Actinoalloteichus]|uniref:Xanthine/uracil permease n=1 Tax=Actinoalloteichus fjordicus TaxID=1612552 RepID=A0AAC9LAW1_9PSEU|nr:MULTISPECIES: solute carrier family 23 protein [Actinoalloteichus]APU13976.1 xanthine/uracil permease [Actinoalloteichus fjordicus]APU19922.1 xanthine/uracil permease [Actinoalloteichus sp. GBA129-24]
MALWAVRGGGRSVRDGVAVAADERLSWPVTIGFGLQHVFAMFGATVLVPLQTGFPVTTTFLFSGLGTLLFLLVTRNRVPSYLGSSFAFVAPLSAAQADGAGPAVLLGGVLVAGLLLVMVGIAVKALGARLLDSLMPPVVTGAVVILIGFTLAPMAAEDVGAQPAVALITLLSIIGIAILGRGLPARLSVLLGVLVGWAVALVVDGVDREAVVRLVEAPWIGLPELTSPMVSPSTTLLVLPVILVVVAETVGHVKAVAAVTGRDLDGSVGDALIGNGLATAMAGAGGGSATTTYAENIGVMAVTKVYSTAAYVIAALIAVLLSLSPKFGALILTMPLGVLGGATMVLFGLIGLVGVRIWVDNRVDLGDPVNLLVAAAALMAGIGDLTFVIGGVELGGVVWGSLLVVVLYPLLSRLSRRLGRGG